MELLLSCEFNIVTGRVPPGRFFLAFRGLFGGGLWADKIVEAVKGLHGLCLVSVKLPHALPELRGNEKIQ